MFEKVVNSTKFKDIFFNYLQSAMRRWVPYPFVRFVIFFICGILAGIYYSGIVQPVVILFLISVLANVVLQFCTYKTSHHYLALPLGICAFIILLALGYLNASFYNEKADSSHISNIETINQNKIKVYRAKLIEPLEVKEKSFGTLVKLEAVRNDSIWLTASGRVLLYIKKDSVLKSSSYSYGDEILFKARLQDIEEPLNPGVFDYKAYLGYQNIFQNAFVSYKYIKLYRASEKASFYGAALRTQHILAEIIKDNIDDKDAENIILSLVLGMKDDLEQPLKDAYTNAGVIHILAVSGLHVGIIFAIFSTLLSWLNKGNTRWLFAVICIAVLWAYAFITGLSPSVLRAVTMFSFIILAKAFAKQYNIYNAIAASAFLLLCYNPYLILSVGFQLSYTAVLGIVFLYTRFYNIFNFENRLLDFCWKMTSVSLAAQVAVMPLSVYYFHQFPVYFLLTNLIIIPAAFLMLVLGISLLAFHFIPFLGPLISATLEYVVIYANKFVYEIALMPFHKIDGLYINEVQAFVLFAILVCVLIFINKKQFSVLAAIALLILIFQALVIINNPLIAVDEKLVYYSNKTTGVLALYQGNNSSLLLTGGKDLSEEDFDYEIKPSMIKSGLDYDFKKALSVSDKKYLKTKTSKFGLVAVWNSKKLLVLNNKIDGEWHLKKDLRIDVLILENNAINNLKQLPSSLKFDYIIIGNTNAYEVANSLVRDAKAKKYRWAYPKKEGAWVANFGGSN